jgi:hypothetical protein
METKVSKEETVHGVFWTSPPHVTQPQVHNKSTLDGYSVVVSGVL